MRVKLVFSLLFFFAITKVAAILPGIHTQQIMQKKRHNRPVSRKHLQDKQKSGENGTSYYTKLHAIPFVHFLWNKTVKSVTSCISPKEKMFWGWDLTYKGCECKTHVTSLDYKPHQVKNRVRIAVFLYCSLHTEHSVLNEDIVWYNCHIKLSVQVNFEVLLLCFKYRTNKDNIHSCSLKGAFPLFSLNSDDLVSKALSNFACSRVKSWAYN